MHDRNLGAKANQEGDRMKIYRGYRRMHLGDDGKPTTQECVVTVERKGKRRAQMARRDVPLPRVGAVCVELLDPGSRGIT